MHKKNNTNAASAEHHVQRLIVQYLHLFFQDEDPGWSKWAQTHYPHLGENRRRSTAQDRKLYWSCASRKNYVKKIAHQQLQGQPQEWWPILIGSILDNVVSPNSFSSDRTHCSEPMQQQSEHRMGAGESADTDTTPINFNVPSLHHSTKRLPNVTIDFDHPQKNRGLICIKNDQIKLKDEQVSVLTFVKPIVCPKDIQVS
jgi:hypothetical protein